MSKFMDGLSKFEAQLQDLVEVGTARVVPKRGRGQISSMLVKAMQSTVELDPKGRRVAADTYILVVGDGVAHILEEDPTIKTAMLQVLIESGEKSGIVFESSPRIKISTDEMLKPGEIEIIPSFGLQEIPNTSTLAIEPENGATIPNDAFLIIEGNQVVPLNKQVINIGRRSDNHIVIDKPQVSRNHAQLRAINNRFVIFDLGSTGGTFVNRIRVEQANLFPGDVISLAGVDLVYGQEAGFFSGESGTTTQPLMPMPGSE
jgi:pSer/pThr/pTyr-binding forkhead associated (FHA) protein